MRGVPVVANQGMGLSRRQALGALAALGGLSLAGSGPAHANPPAGAAPPKFQDFEVRDLSVDGDARVARRFTLLVPKHLAKGQQVPLLILLHGLGEAHDERLGAYAWLERYGLGTSYERLRRPPVERTHARPDWTDARLAEVNARLAKRSFNGFAIACPFTPRVSKSPLGAPVALDVYADWIEKVLIPRARKEAPVLTGGASTFIDGCSMGGPIAIELFSRKPSLFGALGMVQSAFGVHRAPGFAQRIAEAMDRGGPKPVSIITSSGDPFRDANRALAKALGERKVDVTLRESPGPHDQPWLRETGTIEMLLWHDHR